MSEEKIYSALATPNIALVKYWGKRDDKLILPYNSSISITLDEKLNTKTSVVFSEALSSDVFYINGNKQDLGNPEVKERFNIIDELRSMAGVSKHAIVYSVNSFPTASGLASSASGIAALVIAAAEALNSKLSIKELSTIARRGSGSACRSLLGGFVKWNKGRMPNGKDSAIEQVADANYWPEIVDIIAITSRKEKKVLSRAGMKQTVQTSELYALRPKIAERHVIEASDLIIKRDFEKLASIIMRESNNMHAVMLDTYPPIIYLNDTSKNIIEVIHDLNSNSIKAAYTFDAGPNAHIITLDKYKQEVYDAISKIEGIDEIIESKPGQGPRIIRNALFEDEINKIYKNETGDIL